MTRTDASAYQALRLEALTESPEAFGSSPQDERGHSENEVAARCAPALPGLTLGVFHDTLLVGIASYVPQTGIKTAHKARMVGVYLKPDWRKTGLGRQLVEAVIKHARAERVILHCTATMSNLPARRLYHALGFVPYGVEKDALLIDGQGFDEELLMLDLRVDRDETAERGTET